MGCGASTHAVEDGANGEIVTKTSIHEVEVKSARGNLSSEDTQKMSIKVEHVERMSRRSSLGSMLSPLKDQCHKSKCKFQPHDDGPLRGRYVLGKKLGRCACSKWWQGMQASCCIIALYHKWGTGNFPGQAIR
eukprot:3907940-Rhodomonas_salina.1